MAEIESVILGLINSSSIPSFYKDILRRTLPSMSRIQKEELFVMLARENDNASIIVEKGEDLWKRYNMLADRLEKDPEGLFKEMDYDTKISKTSQTKSYSKGKLSSIKGKLDLEALKKQVGGK